MNPPLLVELHEDPDPNLRLRSDPPFKSSRTSGLREFIIAATINRASFSLSYLGR
jgi:hypothetical protein